MHAIRRILTAEAAVLVALALVAAQGGFAQASSYATLYSFKGGSDGASPEGVILSKSGALYGTTLYGGPTTCAGTTAYYLCGTVFELAPAKEVPWTKTVLYSFNGASGALPSYGARLVLGENGALYGTTMAGGSGDADGTPVGGAVFELAPPANAGGTWTESVLYSFPHNYEEPNTPYSGVFIGSEGALYGTTWASHYNTAGGSWGGSAFRLTPPSAPGGSWTESTLWDFWANGDSLGVDPCAGVVSVGGSLYGTTWNNIDGEGCGQVYQLSPPTGSGGAWTGTEIYGFGGPSGDGCFSHAPLTVGPGGVLYGTTVAGGPATPCSYGPFLSSGCGTVFQLTPPAAEGGAWTEIVIYSFTGINGDGALPTAGLVLGENGVLYGTTGYGGSATSGSPCIYYGGISETTGCGTVFSLTPPAAPGRAWTETILHSFTGENGDGGNPGSLVMSSSGVLYGVATSGGTAGAGTIFAVKP
ncbi:MAG: choice-of-anchor tandem repeat GloVer-containing protein [Bryobacteraceae bacterium]